MQILLIAGRNTVGTRLHRHLKVQPHTDTDWFSGVLQTGNDYFLGADTQMLYAVTRGGALTEPQPVHLPMYDLAIVFETDGQSLDGDLRGYQIAGFLAGRSIPTIGVSDSDETRRWFIDYGATRAIGSVELLRDLYQLIEWGREIAIERSGIARLKGLTLWQPWAWAVANGKNVENRHWTTPYRGLVAFHASQPEFQPRGAYEVSCQTLRRILDSIGKKDLAIPNYEALPKGVFFAVGRITDCRPHIESPWYDPLWSQCFQVEDLQVLPEPVPGPTKPLLFGIEPKTARRILAQVPSLVAA